MPLPPLLISFDAYDCLYTPRDPIFQQYYDNAASFGVHMEISEVKQRFTATFRDFEEKYPNYGKSVNWTIEQFWDRFLKSVFTTSVSPPQELVDHLIKHFASAQAYKLYDDVVPTLDHLKKTGVITAVASNADSRVFNLISNSMNLNQYFKTIILSYNVDCEKPSKEFFDKLIDAVWEREKMTCDKDALRKRAWHVGDDLEKDVKGAINAGLNAILIDRNEMSNYLKKEKKFEFVEENYLVVKSLEDIGLALPPYTTGSAPYK